MRTITFNEAIDDLESVLNKVSGETEGILISRNDGKNVVVMSLSQYNSIMETLHLLGSSANAIHLLKSVRQLSCGQMVAAKAADWDEFFETEPAFGEDFLEDRDDIVPQDRDFS